MSRVAIVTGANKGIGFAAVEGLARQFDGIVYMTARDETRGREAVERLKAKLEGSAADKIRYHQLDVSDKESINRFRNYLQDKHAGIDVLINNAGLSEETAERSSAGEGNIAVAVIGVNYYGLKNVCNALFPLLKPHSRVVNVSSRGGSLQLIEDKDMQQRLLSDDLTEQEIDQLMNNCIKAYSEHKERKNAENFKEFPGWSYATSKLGVIAVSRVQSRRFQHDTRQDVIVNSCCPGLVATDMSESARRKHNCVNPGDMLFGMMPLKSVDQGADTLIYLAMLPENAPAPNGEFVCEREVVDWITVPAIPLEPLE